MRRTGTVLLRNSARMSSSPICSSSVFFRSLDTLASSRMVGWNVFSVLPSDFTAWWGTTHASARGRHADGGHAAGAGHTSASPLGPNTMRATTPTSSASGAPTPKKDACTRCGRGGARSATPRTAWQPAARHRACLGGAPPRPLLNTGAVEAAPTCARRTAQHRLVTGAAAVRAEARRRLSRSPAPGTSCTARSRCPRYPLADEDTANSGMRWALRQGRPAPAAAVHPCIARSSILQAYTPTLLWCRCGSVAPPTSSAARSRSVLLRTYPGQPALQASRAS